MLRSGRGSTLGGWAVDWLALVVLGIIWAVLLVPDPRKRGMKGPFERAMPIEEEEFRQPGRWILSPRRGSRFVGHRQRSRLRARERRRRVYILLLEAIGLTGLIGLFPPLRGMLVLTGVLVLLAGAYTALVLRLAMGRSAAQAPEPMPGDVVTVLPEARPEPEFEVEERSRRVVRVAAR
jgi:hypothetical protein